MTLVCVIAAPDTRAYVDAKYVEGWWLDIPRCPTHPEVQPTVVIGGDSPMECVATGRMVRNDQLESALEFEIRWKPGERPT